MRRLAWIVPALAAVACGETAKPQPGPLDQVYRPTGVAVHEGRLLVASSNGDLLYDDATGGSVIAFDPSSLDTVRVDGALTIPSFAGDLAIADPVACPSISVPLAITVTRGSNTLDAIRVAPDGKLSCDRCGVPLTGSFVDPFAVTVACGGGKARAFVGYLRSPAAGSWISEYELDTGRIRSQDLGAGPARALAYHAAKDRLFVLGLATASPTPLRWVELGGCTLGAPLASGGCTVGTAKLPGVPDAFELRSMALAHHAIGDPQPQRAFITGRLYDQAAAAAAGGRANDFGGLLVVVDLVDDAFGGLDLRVVRKLDIGKGAQDVRVLPVLPSRAGKRDVVAALAVDDGELWIYDDDDLSLHRFGRDGHTGAPLLGHQPFGLAVDPDSVGTARLYVGSYDQSYVTPVDVRDLPLDAPDAVSVPTTATGELRRISRGTP